MGESEGWAAAVPGWWKCSRAAFSKQLFSLSEQRVLPAVPLWLPAQPRLHAGSCWQGGDGECFSAGTAKTTSAARVQH